MTPACKLVFTTGPARSTQLNKHKQCHHASCIRPLKNNFVRMKHYKLLITGVFLFFFHAGFSQQKVDSTFNSKDVPIQLFVFMPKLVDINYSLSKPNPIVFKAKDGQGFVYNPGAINVFSTEVRTPKIKIKKNFSFSAGLRYFYYKTQYKSATLNGDPTTFEMPDHASFAKTSVLLSYSFKIGNQPIVLTGVNMTAGNEFWSPKQVTGVLITSFPLRNTTNSTLTLGLILAFPEYKSLIPVPTIIYAKKLRSDLMLDMYLPLHAKLQYISNENRSFICGVKLDKNNPPQYQLNKNYNISENIELKSLSFSLFGSYEYHISGLFWMFGEVGYRYFVNSKIAESSGSLSSYSYISKNTDAFYGNIGIFIRPTFQKAMSAMNARKN